MISGMVLIFLSAFLAATILPIGSEPALLAYWATQLNPNIWLSVAVAGVGNTLGGMVTYAMGRGLREAWQRWRQRVRGQQAGDLTTATAATAATKAPQASSGRTLNWLNRFGPAVLLLSWVPIVGDPLCLAAGSLRLKFIPCLFFMAVGKFGRYATLAGAFVVWSSA
jgi:membrane protein YqaA with SNARE-associated domain